MPTRATRKARTTRPPTSRTARAAFIGGKVLQGTCHQGYRPAVLTSCRRCYGLVRGVDSGARAECSLLSVVPRHSGAAQAGAGAAQAGAGAPQAGGGVVG